MKVRGIRTPGGDVEGIAIAGDHAELVAMFETILRGLPLGATAAPARELAVRCLAVLSTSGGLAIEDGLGEVAAVVTGGDPEGES